jgi:hypothetical protein
MELLNADKLPWCVAGRSCENQRGAVLYSNLTGTANGGFPHGPADRAGRLT